MDLRKPMTDLLEFCRKINCGRLEFNYSKGEESSFNCKVTLLDMEANGSGGSKDDAREVAAFNLLRKLDELPECGDLVKIEDKDKKKEAHQRAASAILSVVSKDADKLPKSNGVKLVPIGTAEDEESEGCDAFETYKKLIQPQKKPKSGDMLLCDRHNYFKNFPQDLKLAAFEILDRSSDKNYPDVKQRALKVMSALKLNHKITPMPSRSVKPILMLEFDCEYDAVLMGYESDIYTQVIQYFRNMLD
ncbi:uncharacterized protein LOC111518709 isoform X3 [Drosophila willistoni]|uniref:uncharacterized protein LOC111518709 isoform X3 n=1 Tax=Drosophila willistoni TaxID=7260 RepID=UPI001F088276|nr:uncharacterized protein LOC111518709 isoform X3 [Drosophila willistoni]